MRTLGLCLALFGALFLVGCGDKASEDSGEGTNTSDSGDADTPEAGIGIPLEGEGWDGGAGFDPTERSEKVRVIAFLKPTWGGCKAEAKRLVQKLKDNPKLEVVGATEATDGDAIDAFRDATGAAFPILMGVSEKTRTAYEIAGYPSVIVLAADGSVAGRDENAIEKCLDGA